LATHCVVAGNPAAGNVQGGAGGVQASTGCPSAVTAGLAAFTGSAACTVVGDHAPNNGQCAGSGVDASPPGAVTGRHAKESIPTPGPVVQNYHVVQGNLAAVVQQSATQGVTSPRQRAVGAIILGQAALDNQVLEDDLRAGVDDLKGPILELAGVNDRGRPGPLDDPAMAGLGQVQVAGEPGRFVAPPMLRMLRL
jgi:hypothetical protein